MKDAKTGEVTRHNFLCPFTVASGKLHRGMAPFNACPSEEGRAAEVAEGRDPPHSWQRKLKDASSPAWLAHQMVQETTRVPPMARNYLVPNWARFFRIKADRSVRKLNAIVADRLNWADL
eukprot:3635895-Pyramimonas_sp.AAC.1